MTALMAKADDMCHTMERIIAPVESKSNPPWRKETETYYKVEMTVDSGAHDSVTPQNTIPGMVPGKGKSTKPYYASTGQRSRITEPSEFRDLQQTEHPWLAICK